MLNRILAILLINFYANTVIALDLKTDEDKISYSIGFIAGEHFKSQNNLGFKLNPDTFIQAFQDSVKNKPQIDKEEVIKYLNIVRNKQIEIMGKQNTQKPQNPTNIPYTQKTPPNFFKNPPQLPTDKPLTPSITPTITPSTEDKTNTNNNQTKTSALELPEQNKTLAINNDLNSANVDNTIFLANNKRNHKIQELKSGLQYQVIVAGNKKAKSPLLTDKVKVHYRGTLINGEEFDSSYQKQPAVFQLNAVIKGWQEALSLMKPNAKWKIFIPPHLAYGSEGSGIIPPNSTLIFDVELLEINPKL